MQNQANKRKDLNVQGDAESFSVKHKIGSQNNSDVCLFHQILENRPAVDFSIYLRPFYIFKRIYLNVFFF